MKNKKAWVGALLATVLLLGACTASAAGTSDESQVGDMQVYRGEVTEVRPDGALVVSQPEGQDYGHESVVFNLDAGVSAPGVLDNLKGSFVQVRYNGALTKSLPPQGLAQEFRIIANGSDGIVVNGTVQKVEDTDGGYRVFITPFDAPSDDLQNQIILTVPAEALEGLTEADLVEGALVSAVTSGIAATSLPPQMPVVALLPYTASPA